LYLQAFQFAIAIVYAPFVLYVTKTYTHSWMEKLQMLPLCIIAVAAPMLWAIMIWKISWIDAEVNKNFLFLENFC